MTGTSGTPGERRLRLRVLVDTSAVEVFDGDGRVSLSTLVFPGPDAQDMAFTATGGTARLVRVTVHRRAGVFRVTDAAPPAPTGAAFRTARLGELDVVPAGHWTVTGAGRTGPFDRDSTTVSATEYGVPELTARVRFGAPDGTSGAGSVLIRASADAAEAHAVNLDPNLRTVRLFRKDAGEAAVLAETPLPVRTGTSLPVRIRARGDRIEVFVDGRSTIDVTDTRCTRGRIGLKVSW